MRRCGVGGEGDGCSARGVDGETVRRLVTGVGGRMRGTALEAEWRRFLALCERWGARPSAGGRGTAASPSSPASAKEKEWSPRVGGEVVPLPTPLPALVSPGSEEAISATDVHMLSTTAAKRFVYPRMTSSGSISA